jgi:hypothetical protein
MQRSSDGDAMGSNSSDSDEENNSGVPTSKLPPTASKIAADKLKLDFTQDDWAEQLTSNRQKLGSKRRALWYVPSCQRHEVVASAYSAKQFSEEISLSPRIDSLISRSDVRILT